jgi:hypothetical protein
MLKNQKSKFLPVECRVSEGEKALREVDPTPMTTKNRALSVVLLVSPLLLLGLGLWRHVSNPVAREKARNNAAYAHVLANWTNCTFTPLAPDVSLDALAGKIEVRRRCETTPVQEEALRAALCDMIRAFSVGEFEAYTRFLRPVPATPNEPRFTMTKQLFQGQSIKVPESVLKDVPKDLRHKQPTSFKLPAGTPAIATNADAEQVLKTLFERASRGTRYRDWWQGICVTQSFVIVERETTMPPPFLATVATNRADYGTNYYGFDDVSEMPFYKYSASPSETLAADGSIAYASVRCLIALKDPDPPVPFLVRFYWNSRYEKWVVWKFVLGNGKRSTKVLPAF